MSGIIAQNTLDNSGLIKAPAGGGAWNFIAKQTASADATINFTSGIDSTYKEYIFTFNNIHPETDNQDIQFNASVDSGSSYDVAKTSSTFQAQHDEADSETALQYNTDRDLAQGTGAQRFSLQIGNANDECVAGTLHLFDPSNTTFVKHFISRVNGHNGSAYSQDFYTAGYMNTTSAVDAIQFSFQSGNIDAGDICLYGIST
jgi:hypothetical protein